MKVPSFTFQLRSLCFANIFIYIPVKLCQELFRSSANSLRYLDFDPRSESTPFDLPQLPALIHLTLHSFGDPSKDLAHTIPSCPALQFLRINALPADQLHLLPRQLRSLVTAEADEPEKLAPLLSDNTREALHQLVVEEGGREKWEELGEGLGWFVERFGDKVRFLR